VRIRWEGRLVSLRDRAAPFWALGLFLFAGGVLAVLMPLGLATNAGELEPWERLASTAVGLGVCAGALWWLERSPGTEVQVESCCRSCGVTTSAASGRLSPPSRSLPFALSLSG